MSEPNNCSDSDYLSSLLALGKQSGLDAVGVASAEPFVEARAALEERRSRGLASSMQFTYRNPKRSCDPSVTLPGAKSLIVGALRYEGDGEAAGERMFVRIASYAQRDYYSDLRDALEAVAKRLQDDGHEARVVVDDNALMDREAARRAGLGWYGKNTCLLIPKKGSRFVLGSVITTAALAPSPPVERTCGTCSLCQQACPTGALDTAGQLDARRCLAWLLQAEGIFPREHRAALGNRFYGCDDCQDVCPINSLGEMSQGNRRATAHLFLDSDRELARKRRAVPRLPLETQETSCGTVQENLDSAPVLEVLKLTDEELMDRYGRFYIPRRQPRYLRRNALLVLANVSPLEACSHFEADDREGGADGGANGFEEVNAVSGQVNAALKEAVEHEDPMLRAHGVWAAQRLGRFDLAESANCDPDARVREEARRPVPLAEPCRS